jgi:hypothetical protein
MSITEYIMDFDEVDAAIVDKFAGFVIDGREVPVTYFSPDIDFQDAEYPAIVVYRMGEQPDYSRWDNGDVRDNWKFEEDGETPKSVDIRLAPEPWNIIYAIRLFTDFQDDMIKLKRFFHVQMPRSAFIAVKGINYDVGFVDYSLPGAGYKDFGKTDVGNETQREFSDQYLVKVEISLDIHSPVTVPVVKEFRVRRVYEL